MSPAEFTRNRAHFEKPLVRNRRVQVTNREINSHRTRGITSLANNSIDRRAFAAGIPGNCTHITR